MQTIIDKIKKKKDINKLVDEVIKKPALIKDLITTIKTNKSSLKFNCEKALRLVSEKKPKLVYPYYDFFVGLLDSNNNFLKWGAIITIANMADCDSKNKFKKLFKKYYQPVKGPVMITAANIIGNSWKIVKAKPQLAEKIVDEMLKVEQAKYINQGKISPECKNVVIGKAIESLAKFSETIIHQDRIVKFVIKQASNTRPSVRRVAIKFLKKTQAE